MATSGDDYEEYGSPQVWYRLTATSTGVVLLSTIGTESYFRSSLVVFEVYLASPGNWQRVASAPLYTTSECGVAPSNIYTSTYACLLLSVRSGKSYAIRVATTDDRRGLFKLSWTTGST